MYSNHQCLGFATPGTLTPRKKYFGRSTAQHCSHFSSANALSVRIARNVIQCRADSGAPQTRTRRSVLATLAALTISVVAPTGSAKAYVEPYDALTTRRYVQNGRPPPDRPAPRFSKDKPIFQIDDELKAQDVVQGSGGTVGTGTLVFARWVAILEDGSTVDDSNEKQPALFRPGAHQVPPGIEDSILGMRAGGVRRVSATAERILR